MKTAISLPDRLFKDAERLARRLKRSRSRLYADALAEYMARHDPDSVTSRINAVVDVREASLEPLVRDAGDRILRRTEWKD